MSQLRILAGTAITVAAVTASTVAPAAAHTRDRVPCDGAALQGAVVNANDGDTLELTPRCIYKLTIPDPSDSDTGLVIHRKVTLQGNGSTIARRLATQDFRIFKIESGGDLTLNHLTISGGRAAGSGGGVLLDASDAKLTLNRSNITKNSATDFGGGIANGANDNGGRVTVRYSDLRHNSANYGGGMWQSGSSATAKFRYSRITSNSAISFGGGFESFDSSKLTLDDSEVTENSAPYAGGGIDNYNQSTTTLNGTLVHGNKTNGDGGGIHNDSGTLNLYKSVVIANKAIGPGRPDRPKGSGSHGGGIANIGSGVAILKRSWVAYNIAAEAPGGIWNTGTVMVIHTTVKKNRPGNCAPSNSMVIGCRD
jgi:hypothetical protein